MTKPKQNLRARSGPHADRHSRAALRYGWTAVAVFMLIGLFLESLHLVKAPFYMEINIRRELWTLAHAHGTLLGVLNIVFGLCAQSCIVSETKRATASVTLRTGALLMPVGFFAGGFYNSEVDPSPGILLVPIGALLVLHAVTITAIGTWGEKNQNADRSPS